jgi:hypothetical protein
MNCLDFESRLNDELDSSSAELSPELLEHRAQCAACCAAWERFRLLSDGISAWRQATPDVDLAPAVVFALRQSTETVPPAAGIAANPLADSLQCPKRRVPVWAVAAAAACLVVASLLAVVRPGALSTRPVAQVPAHQGELTASHDNRQGEDRPSKDHFEAGLSDTSPSEKKADSTPRVAGLHSPVLQSPALDSPALNSQGPETDRAAYYDLAQRTAGALGQMSMLVLPSVPAKSDAALPAENSAPADPSGWIDEFERELKPVGRSLGNAFDFLWRAGESADG